MNSTFGVYLSLGLFLGACAVLVFWQTPVMYLRGLIIGHDVASYSVFVLLLVGATVFMPVSVLPLIHVVAPIFGPFLTGVLSIIGWTLGAAGAFGIARWCGRPLLERFMSLAKVDRAVAHISSETRFLTIVLLRMTLPVDIVSYALGLSRSVAFAPYIVATIIGVSYFSFAFAYLGDALFAKHTGFAALLGGGSLVLFLVCWAILIRHMRTHKR